MLSKWSAETKMLTRGFAAIAASVGLVGCAMHEGSGQRMQMEAMHENPMHQMMQEMGCAASKSNMPAMKKMTPEEKHRHMKAHMLECKAKMRQQAADEAMAKIDQCVEERATNRHLRRASPKRMRAMLMAEIRVCTSKKEPTAVQPANPSTHDGH